MRLREFTDSNNYLPPEPEASDRLKQIRKKQNDRPNDDAIARVTRKPNLREKWRSQSPGGFNRR